MRFVVRALSGTLAIAVTLTAAFAQSYSARQFDGNGSQKSGHITIPANGRPSTTSTQGRSEYCCITGPVYGREGEPLGPALWGNSITNVRTCGPGACQDNPNY
jgi:hypothetical protein